MSRASRLSRLLTLCAASLALLAGCGGSHGASQSSGSQGSAGSEAQSAATGDIPDTQVFLRYEDRTAGWSIKYPEGWSRRGSGSNVAFQEKGNRVRVVIAAGKPPTPAAASAALAKLKGAGQITRAGRASRVTLPGGQAVKVTYYARSKPDPVTGKRLVIVVDRYLIAASGRTATVDLSTPRGVDNVDAYRLISKSFHWS